MKDREKMTEKKQAKMTQYSITETRKFDGVTVADVTLPG